VWDPREPLPPLNETLEIVLCCVVCSILLQRVGRFREFDRVAGEGSEGDRGNVGPEVEDEGVQSCTQTHRGKDPETNPVETPDHFTLYSGHILCVYGGVESVGFTCEKESV